MEPINNWTAQGQYRIVVKDGHGLGWNSDSATSSLDDLGLSTNLPSALASSLVKWESENVSCKGQMSEYL